MNLISYHTPVPIPRTCCIVTLCTWSSVCCVTTTASVQGRTCWLWKPLTQNRRNAAFGFISAAARWVGLKWTVRLTLPGLHVCVFLLISMGCVCEQEQAQSICKVLSASFDCALTSGKSWGPRWRRAGDLSRRNVKQLQTTAAKNVIYFFKLLFLSFFLPSYLTENLIQKVFRIFASLRWVIRNKKSPWIPLNTFFFLFLSFKRHKKTTVVRVNNMVQRWKKTAESLKLFVSIIIQYLVRGTVYFF